MESFVPRREASAIGQGYWRFVGGGESTSKDWVDSISIDITTFNKFGSFYSSGGSVFSP
jgi:hypothetical protein